MADGHVLSAMETNGHMGDFAPNCSYTRFEFGRYTANIFSIVLCLKLKMHEVTGRSLSGGCGGAGDGPKWHINRQTTIFPVLDLTPRATRAGRNGPFCAPARGPAIQGYRYS